MEVPAVIETAPDAYTGSNVEIIEMDRMRKLIAKHMVDSKRTSPHVTSFAEADVTNMVLWREKVKKEFERRKYQDHFYAAVYRLPYKGDQKYPIINSSVDGERIIIKRISILAWPRRCQAVT